MLDRMMWGFQKKGKLPLSSEVGYCAMIQQIKVQKDLSALIIVVALPLPKIPQPKHQMEENIIEQEADNTLWGQKVSFHIVSLSCKYSCYDSFHWINSWL